MSPGLSWYGWCCERECREEATKRAQIQAGDGPVLIVPLCEHHLIAFQAATLALSGHELAAVIHDPRSEGA